MTADVLATVVGGGKVLALVGAVASVWLFQRALGSQDRLGLALAVIAFAVFGLVEVLLFAGSL